MKILNLFMFVVLMASCSSKPSLCDCVEAGDSVNKISASLFDRAPTQEAADSLKEAERTRDSICSEFQTMMPDELQKKAEECKSLDFSTED